MGGAARGVASVPMIDIRRDGAVAVLTIDRHASRNSLDAAVCNRIREAVEELVPAVRPEGADHGVGAGSAEAGDAVRALVITGAGTAFCAGADLSGGVYGDDFHDALLSMLRTVEAVPVPVVAAVNGPAVGAGVQLALASDLRVVAPGAFFAIPVVKVGLALDTWTIRRLGNVVGGGHARSMLMTARPMSAERAEMLGLANWIGGFDEALALAHELAGFAPLSLQHVKAVINDDDAHLLPREEHTDLQRRAWASEDMAEARAARGERRPPVFRGR